MNEQNDKYNLLTEPWIPVLWNNGKYGRVGIIEAFTYAGSIRQIAASNPMDRVAVLRFLLASLYWCKGNPSDPVDMNSGDSFPGDWFSKLHDHRECFNLLGDGKRFYQYSISGRTRDEKLSSNYLIQEIPTGNNKWHFRHSTDKIDGLCPACCAMGLLRIPVFATSGGRGKPPGINAKPPIYAMPMGESLATTLQLLWSPSEDLGTPSWEQPDRQLPNSGTIPLLAGLTWIPRRVWLDDPEKSEASCMSCGMRHRLIRQCVFAGIGSTRIDENGPGRIWRDPHVVYSNKGDFTCVHASDPLGSSDAAANQWTKILAGTRTTQQNLDCRMATSVVGFATVQNDKYLEAKENVIPVFSAQHGSIIEKTEQWQKEASGLVRRLRPQNESGTKREHPELLSALAGIRPHIEHTVSSRVGELLTGDNSVWERAAGEYRPLMSVVAKSLAPGFTTTALERRRQIASVIPDMREKAPLDKKSGRKKGGDK